MVQVQNILDIGSGAIPRTAARAEARYWGLDGIGVPQVGALEDVLEGGPVEHRGLRVLCPT